MPTDTELEILNTRLNAFALASEEHHDTLQNLLQEYQNLIASHRQLKSDYEEEKKSREKYKKLARGRVS
jgi:phage shock protein A